MTPAPSEAWGTPSVRSEHVDDLPCFIIHERGYRERSLILEILSLSRGRVSAVAHLSRRAGFREREMLRPFAPLSLSLSRRRGELWNVTRIEPSGQPYVYQLPDLFCAQYLNELLYNLYHEQEEIPELFGVYLQSLAALGDGSRRLGALRRFETVLLRSLGFAVRFEDVRGRAPSPALRYAYDPGTGFFACADASVRTYPGEVLLDLRRGRLESDEQLSSLKEINGSLIRHLLGGRRLMSRKLYRDYLNERRD